ncbi:MAG: hypothetical protein FWD06_03685 [Oscillospiraceae bacterium]|nr:hypothetical protein [Oscillospiraceae bacterium]
MNAWMWLIITAIAAVLLAVAWIVCKVREWRAAEYILGTLAAIGFVVTIVALMLALFPGLLSSPSPEDEPSDEIATQQALMPEDFGMHVEEERFWYESGHDEIDEGFWLRFDVNLGALGGHNIHYTAVLLDLDEVEVDRWDEGERQTTRNIGHGISTFTFWMSPARSENRLRIGHTYTFRVIGTVEGHTPQFFEFDFTHTHDRFMGANLVGREYTNFDEIGVYKFFVLDLYATNNHDVFYNVELFADDNLVRNWTVISVSSDQRERRMTHQLTPDYVEKMEIGNTYTIRVTGHIFDENNEVMQTRMFNFDFVHEQS